MHLRNWEMKSRTKSTRSIHPNSKRDRQFPLPSRAWLGAFCESGKSCNASRIARPSAQDFLISYWIRLLGEWIDGSTFFRADEPQNFIDLQSLILKFCARSPGLNQQFCNAVKRAIDQSRWLLSCCCLRRDSVEFALACRKLTYSYLDYAWPLTQVNTKMKFDGNIPEMNCKSSGLWICGLLI